jgi:hypothetical protein
MASISDDGNGRKRILFIDGSGDRKAIRLGKISVRMAEKIKIMVEALNAARTANCSPDRETAAWVADLGDDLHTKLAAVGLTTPRRMARLGEFLDAFIDNRRSTAAPNTIKNLEQAKRRLVEFFGPDRDMRIITLTDADEWASALAKNYAPATAGRTIKRARQFFKMAIRDKIVMENPFIELRASGQANKERQHHIDADIIARVIDAAPDHEWRLIIALSRFGGLRCPSEHRPALARHGLGAEPLPSGQPKDGRTVDSDVPGAAAPPGNCIRAGRGRRGLLHQSISGQQRQPAHHVHEDHQAGGREGLAEAVSQSAGKP